MKLKINITQPDWQEAADTTHEKKRQIKGELWEDMRIGRYSVLIRADTLDKYLPQIKSGFPDISNLALKIFLEPFKDDYKSMKWGAKNFSIYESSIIQNMFANEGLAPRVYNLIIVEDDQRKYLAQITEDLGECDGSLADDVVKEFYGQKIGKVTKKFGIHGGQDFLNINLVNGKWVDFQDFRFIDKENEKLRIKRELEETAIWQGNVYQSIPEFGIKGVRDDSRLKIFNIQPADFKDKKVLVLGCSGGEICNFTSPYASRVVGVDTKVIVDVARQASNFAGYFNIDYYDTHLRTGDFFFDMINKFDKFDVIFHLSMYQHIGFTELLPRLMHKDSVLYFEGNPPYTQEEFEEMFKLYLSRIEQVGVSHDFGARLLYKLQL